MNEDEKKSKVVFVDLEEYKQKGKVRKDPDPVPKEVQKTAPAAEKKKEEAKIEEIKPEKTGAPAGAVKPELESPPSFESIIEEKKKISETKKTSETKSTAEIKKPEEKPKTASASPAKKESGIYATKSGKVKKKWIYDILGATLIFGLIVYFIWDYREKKAEEKENAFESVKTALENENYDVIISAGDLIEEYPDDSRGYEYLATAYYGKGEYEKALEVLDDGRANADDTAYKKYGDLYDDAETKRDYYALIASAEENVQAGQTEAAEEDYLSAIEVDASVDDAYYSLTDLYFAQGQYDKAIQWLDTTGYEGEYTYTVKHELELRCYLAKLYTMMQKKNYAGLQQWFENESSALGLSGDVYYQNGQISSFIEEGSGVILTSNGIYAGEIKENRRNGKGIQFGIYLDGYALVSGNWSNDKANGKCTYSFVNPDDKTENYTYKGNLKDNYYDGDITYDTYCRDGKIRSFAIHADNGTFQCIRVEDGQYVFGESSDNWYVYGDSEESLKNRGIWALY